MLPRFHRLLLFSFVFWLHLSDGMSNMEEGALGKTQSHRLSLGAIVDYTSRAGKEERVAMEMAIQDFYAHFSYRPSLLVRNSRGDPFRAVSSAKTLIQKHEVSAVIGLGTWQEAISVAELGNKSQVPILSLASEVPYWAFSRWPFLVNAARSQFSQMKAVAAIIQSWQWRKVNIIYEDSNSAVSGIIPYLISALQDAGSEVNDLLPLPPFLSHRSLEEKLRNLKNEQCRVFIVHTSAALAANVFMDAKNLGLMEKEFVWITTASITDEIDTFNASTISSMQGVLGIMSYFSRTRKRFKDFESSFQVSYHSRYPNDSSEPGIFALQAYEAVRAVAIAMEGKTGFRNSTDNFPSGAISGQTLLTRILESSFEGLTGMFNFRRRALAPAHVFRIVNVVGKSYRELGYWSEGLGFSESIGKVSNYSKSMRILGQVFWPGGPWSVPRGWAIPTTAKPLKIGVPSGNTHKEFVDVIYEGNPAAPGAYPKVTGFSIAVFNATAALLPYHLPYDFVPFSGTYDSLVNQVHLEKFDAVVGDTAIIANRCEYVEFSQPYAESGLQMLIYVKPKNSNRAWLFKKPFTTMMWVSTGIINAYNGFVVWLIEREHNPDFRGTLMNQIGTMLSLAFTTLFSLQGDRLHSNLSRMTMVVWLFVALLITQSFTASLTSLLTVERLNAASVDVETLKKSGAKIGCDGDSFVVQYLEVVVGFHPENIRKMYSEDDYAPALIKGEIAAAFLEVPYVKVFLAKHCSGFATSGPTYKVGGFGFAFPRGSPYLPDISEAVVKVSENGKLQELEHSLISSRSCSASKSDDNHDSLGLTSFWGLFVITGGTSSISLALFVIRNVRRRWNCQSRVGEEDEQHNPLADDYWLFACEMNNQR